MKRQIKSNVQPSIPTDNQLYEFRFNGRYAGSFYGRMERDDVEYGSHFKFFAPHAPHADWATMTLHTTRGFRVELPLQDTKLIWK